LPSSSLGDVAPVAAGAVVVTSPRPSCRSTRRCGRDVVRRRRRYGRAGLAGGPRGGESDGVRDHCPRAACAVRRPNWFRRGGPTRRARPRCGVIRGRSRRRWRPTPVG
jgi:hypothetical protein